MLNTLIVIFAVILLVVLLFFEKQGAARFALPAKTVLSGMFIIAAAVQPHPLLPYYQWVLIGLVFCLLGDVCLALPQDKMFFVGLVSFLLGHVLYCVGFFSISNINPWTWIGATVTVCASIGSYLWLKPGLGEMHVPVVCYIVVITLMLIGAWSVAGEPGLLWSGRMIVLIGAATFYISDLFVGRDRFLKSGFVNRLIGLPLYYLGQFFLAFSVNLL